MDNRIVFAIDTIAPADDLFQVDGRAYQDLRIGDRVRIDDRPATFVVADILTYCHHVPELNRMLTGSLFLRHESADVPTTGTYLLRVDESAPQRHPGEAQP